MTQPTPIERDLEAEIRTVCCGPLDEFVSRRDALVKQLRAAKRSDDAARVKALRKPSRMAWLLDAIVDEDPASIERLVASITEAQTGANLRIAMEAVKTAVRDVAAVGARVAVRAGSPVEPNTIAVAVHAVIGDASAFAELRAGRLVDVPEAGGLDMLAALAVTAASPKSTSSPSAPASTPQLPKHDPSAELAASARADLRRAERSLADAREQSEQIASALRDAKERFDAAERELHHAQVNAKARRDDLERAQREAESVTASLDGAEQTLDAARSRLRELGET